MANGSFGGRVLGGGALIDKDGSARRPGEAVTPGAAKPVPVDPLKCQHVRIGGAQALVLAEHIDKMNAGSVAARLRLWQTIHRDHPETKDGRQWQIAVGSDDLILYAPATEGKAEAAVAPADAPIQTA